MRQFPVRPAVKALKVLLRDVRVRRSCPHRAMQLIEIRGPLGSLLAVIAMSDAAASPYSIACACRRSGDDRGRGDRLIGLDYRPRYCRENRAVAHWPTGRRRRRPSRAAQGLRRRLSDRSLSGRPIVHSPLGKKIPP